ncbi:response regulator transcription factor [Oxalobacteraceae sp. CFBP 13708]|jgi:DNA-binding NarL/FixJ family response regulator|nr:response regulator transcription factor [Oxalobacteraceae sp. CFBP 8761]MBD8627233.1 response regulator transcription factor [Oxalobacteraceae sp. CFBP 8753]MBD8723905.1 response regulator transcription factor [Oxalobacteraceae sp. CFBP 13708]
MDKSPISLVIADDHPLILAGLASLIESEPDLALLGQGASAAEAVALYERLRPDVMLVDLNMPGGGLEAIIATRRMHPDARIVMLTSYEGDENVHRALQAGAAGYLLKQAGFEEIVRCVRQVVEQRRYLPALLADKLALRIHTSPLSRRELDILAHLSAGKSNKLIARDAGIGVGTVKYHVNNILSKLNVSCRTEAASVAQQRGLLHAF